RGAFNIAIALDPKNGQFYGGLALAELALGKNDAALAEIDQAKRIDPNFHRWRYTRGMILARSGREAEAAIEFQTAAVYTLALPGGGMKDVYFDGEREAKRCRELTEDGLKAFWDYGGRWLPPGAYQDYAKYYSLQ